MNYKGKILFSVIFLILLFVVAKSLGFLSYTPVERVTDQQQIPTPVATSSTSDLIRVSYPTENATVTSPLVIMGEARGNWFFEASAPVILTNWDGLIIAEGIAEVEGDWMTTEFVPFTATINFVKPDYNPRGFLILKKDNPSGLPENDAALEIPIYFK